QRGGRDQAAAGGPSPTCPPPSPPEALSRSTQPTEITGLAAGGRLPWLDLGSSVERREGSTPSLPTTLISLRFLAWGRVGDRRPRRPDPPDFPRHAAPPSPAWTPPTRGRCWCGCWPTSPESSAIP